MKNEAIILLLILTSITVLGSEINIEPEKRVINTQEEFYIDIILNLDNETAYGLEMKINEPEKTQITNYEFLEIPEVCMKTAVKDEGLKIGILCPTNIPETGLNGTKKIIRISYLVLEEGIINIISKDIFLSDKNGKQIEINIVVPEKITIIEPNISIELKTENGFIGDNLNSQLCIKSNYNLSAVKTKINIDEKIEITNITSSQDFEIEYDNNELLISGNITANENCIEIALFEINLLQEGISTIKLNNSIIIEEEEIRINDITEEIEITEKELYLECTGTFGEQNDEVNIAVYLKTNYARVGELEFEQSYGAYIEYLDTTKMITQNATLTETKGNYYIKIDMTNLNITKNEYILKIKYKITANSGISNLNFEDVLITNINGTLLEPTEHQNCKITIEEPVSSDSTSGSSKGSGTGSSSSATAGQSSSSDSSSGGANMIEAYSSLLTNQEINSEEGVFYTQKSNEKQEENSETETKESEDTEDERRRTVPLIIVAITAALGIAAVAVFELRK